MFLHRMLPSEFGQSTLIIDDDDNNSTSWHPVKMGRLILAVFYVLADKRKCSYEELCMKK